MKLNRLIVEGFESAAERVEIDFTGKNMVAFTGENGSGKSMLAIWAPLFAFYGKVRTSTIKEAISTTSGQAYVELEYTVDNNKYKITRNLPRIGSQEASLYVYDDEDEEWKIKTEKHTKLTNPAIIETLGMDYDIARTTFISEQKNDGVFCESLPSGRRNILTQLLNLRGYDDLKNAADGEYKASSEDVLTYSSKLEEIASLRSSIFRGEEKFSDLSDEDIEDELAELHESDQELQKQEAAFAFKRDNVADTLQKAKSSLQKFQDDKQSKITSLSRTIASLRNMQNPNRITSVERDLERVADAKMRLKAIDHEIEALVSRVERGKTAISEDEISLDMIKDAASDKNAEKSVIESSLNELLQQQAELKKSVAHGAECTTCHQPLSKELYQQVLNTIHEKQSQLNSNQSTIENMLRKLREDYTNTSKALRSKKSFLEKLETDLSNLMQEKAGLSNAVSNEQNLKEQLSDLQERQRTAMKDISTHEQEMRELEELVTPPEILREVDEAQEQYDQVMSGKQVEFDYSGRVKISALEREMTNRETARNTEAALDERKEQTEAALKKAEENQESYDILRKAFSPTGIPAMIMAGAVQEIENDANEYLEKLSNGKLSLNIETQKTTQKGKVNEEILVTVNAGDGTRDYKSFSGGQQFRINLAIRIAMSKLYAKRNGSSAVQTIFIDEGFGSLDADGVRHVLSSLTELSEDLSIVAVSHVDSIKDGFPNLIETSLDTGTTVVQEITSSTV